MVTKKEGELLRTALANNRLTKLDFQRVYSPVYVSGIIEKFLALGFIEQDIGDKFKINKTKIQDALK